MKYSLYQTMFMLIDKTLATCSMIGIAAGGLITLVIAVIGAADMVSSSFFNSPFRAANVFSEQLLPAAVLLSTGYVLRIRASIVVDILTNSMGKALRTAVNFLSSIAVAIFFAALSLGAWKMAIGSIKLMELAVAAIEFPVWPMKIGYAIGATIALFESVSLLITSIPGLGLKQYQYPKMNAQQMANPEGDGFQ